MYEESLEGDLQDVQERCTSLSKAIDSILYLIDQYGLCEGHGELQAAIDSIEQLL